MYIIHMYVHVSSCINVYVCITSRKAIIWCVLNEYGKPKEPVFDNTVV